MANTKQFSFDDLTIDKFKNIDLSTLSELSDEEKAHFTRTLPAMIGAVAYSGDMLDKFQSVFDFPFDMQGLGYVEQFLNTQVKPKILKWDDLSPKKVKLPSGLKSSSADAISYVNVQFFLAQAVASQCLAQMFSLKCQDGMNGVIGTDNLKVSTSGKVRKYVRFGDEDGLQHYARYISNVRLNNTKVVLAKEGLIKAGVTLPKDVISQVWTLPNGEVEGVSFLDAITRKEITSVQLSIKGNE